jgi:hypothetical protein
MNRHEFLSGLHERYAPRNYVEIGVNDGRGLARSGTRTIGVDPAFKITAELACDLQLVKATSDDFFARTDPLAWFAEDVIDLCFIDGLHIFEFALRDFMNAERLSGGASIVVFDDMLPRSVAEAARDRHTNNWTGDVYKVTTVLERYRPDLVIVPINTTPTGLLLVAGLDPTNTVLADNYDAIIAEYTNPDPQDVPPDVMHRKTAADPDKVLSTSAWADLAAARISGGGHPDSLAAVNALRGSSDFVWTERPADPWPTPKQAPVPRPASAKPAAAAAKNSGSRWTVARIRKAIKRRL